MVSFNQFLIEKIVSKDLISVMSKDPNVKIGLEFEMILSKKTIRLLASAYPELVKKMIGDFSYKNESSLIAKIEYLDAYEFAATALMTELKWKVNINKEYHEKKKALDAWTIETDGTLKGDNWQHIGMELVSPPTSMGEMFKYIEQLQEFMKKYSIYTNESTGLHVNVSVGNTKGIDPLKLALMGGLDYESRRWGRVDNEFAESIIRMLKNDAEWNWDKSWAEEEKQNGVKKMIAIVKQFMPNLKNKKYYQVNLVHKSHVEFRFAGGKNYEHDLDKIKSTIYNVVSAYVIAKTPELYRDEYYKKVYKLFDTMESQSEGYKVPEGVEHIRRLMEQFDNVFKVDVKRFKVASSKSELKKYKEYNDEIEEGPKHNILRDLDMMKNGKKKMSPRRLKGWVDGLAQDIEDLVQGFGGLELSAKMKKWLDLFRSAVTKEL